MTLEDLFEAARKSEIKAGNLASKGLRNEFETFEGQKHRSFVEIGQAIYAAETWANVACVNNRTPNYGQAADRIRTAIGHAEMAKYSIIDSDLSYAVGELEARTKPALQELHDELIRLDESSE